MAKSIKINGVDYTKIFTPTGYIVSYEKRRGPNSGYMMSGSFVDDVRAIKAVVTCFCMPLDEDKLAEFLSAISDTYIEVEYFDPKIKSYRTTTMLPSEPEQTYKGRGSNFLEYWTGTVITFREK